MELPLGSSALKTMAIWDAFVIPFPPKVCVKVCEAPVFTLPTFVVPPLARTPVLDVTSAPPERLTLPDSVVVLPGLWIVRIVATVPRPLPVTPPRLASKIRSAEAAYGVERAAVIPRTIAKNCRFMGLTPFLTKTCEADRQLNATSLAHHPCQDEQLVGLQLTQGVTRNFRKWVAPVML